MRTWVFAVLSCAAAWCQDSRALFEKHCASCHRAGSETRAPLPDVLAQMPRQKILSAFESGSMKAQGAALSSEERSALAAFLSRTVDTQASAGGNCPAGSSPVTDSTFWNGWGVDAVNSRFQPAAMAKIAAADVPRLKLKWAFGFGGTSAIAQPALVAGRLYFGSENGTVYSIDARTGCVYWTFQAPATVRTAISAGASQPGRYHVYFGDTKANVYALDAHDGKLLWQRRVDEHAYARITGAPKLHSARLYVPVSSVEEVPAGNPKYACCTFRGSVVALDVETGEQLWKTYAIPDPPKPTRMNPAGTQLQGPAGAAIWSSPTLDLQRRVLYVATGNGYSDPPVKYTDAVLALDMDTGSIKWARQMTPNDGWNFSCINPNRTSCPEAAGDDFDFGASPILRGRLILAGQKSGIVHALDADRQGEIVWQTRIGKGGALGGVEWGMAADDRAVYVPLSDIARATPEAGGGLFALSIDKGERLWNAPPPKPACLGKPGCSAAQMAPATAMPGVVFSGSMDGRLRAYAAESGKLLWEFDTLREFETVNGVKARGGSLNATGPVVAGGMLYVNSGYGILGGMPGNVLLAFSVDGK